MYISDGWHDNITIDIMAARCVLGERYISLPYKTGSVGPARRTDTGTE